MLVLAAANHQPDNLQTKWGLRHTAARLYADAGDWKRALVQAKLAWESGADAPVGAFLVRAFVHNGMREEAERTYAQIAQRIDPDNSNDRHGLKELRNYLDRPAIDSGKPIPSD